MASKLEVELLALNRGLVSPLALARLDLKRSAWSAETMTNWMPRTLGSMMLRPGWQYLLNTRSNLATRYLPFVRSATAKALIELTDGAIRVIVDDEVIARPSVSTAVTNGTFDTDLTGWTDNDEAGATSAWVTGGLMGLTGTGTNAAIRDQTVTVAVADQGVLHALDININRGPVVLRVGTGTTDDSYINETTLETGRHSLAFTPTGDFNIRFMSRLERIVYVSSCEIDAAGAMTLSAPWAAADLQNVRSGPESQSVDVLFVACTGYGGRRIERRGAESWSVVEYKANDGPYRAENTSVMTMEPSVLSGNGTLTASAAFFRSTHAPSAAGPGALFRIESEGQRVEELDITAQDTWSDAIRVTGVDSARIFTIIRANLSGTGSTATLQRSLESDVGPWENVTTYTTDATITYDDGLDNQIAWYRIGVATGNYAGGTIDLTLDYALGSITGHVRVTSITSSTIANVEVLDTLGGLDPTPVWAEGAWSDYRGWPSACCLYESRLWWIGLDNEWATITDAYASFDESFEGDAGPISRSIGSGPVETLVWILPLTRLIVGGLLAEFSSRSSNFDEPLTPTNFNIKASSGQGSASVQALKLDDDGLMVQRGGTRLFELAFSPESYSYKAKDLCVINPEVCKPQIVRVQVQRQPDTRIHCVLSDGTVAVLVYDQAENVTAWCKVDTDGLVEDVVVLPGDAGDAEDQVYYVVARTINSTTVRFLEKWALESEAVGETVNKQADAFVVFTNAPASTTVSGLDHLIGEEVIVWQDGVCPEDADGYPETYTVNGSGEITLDTAATTGVVGLAYTAPWKGAKLGQVLSNMKNVRKIAPILKDTHPKGLYYGPSLTVSEMDTLPLIQDGEIIDPDAIISTWDDDPIEFDGAWSNDARLCLMAYAPRPCTLLAVRIEGDASG